MIDHLLVELYYGYCKPPTFRLNAGYVDQGPLLQPPSSPQAATGGRPAPLSIPSPARSNSNRHSHPPEQPADVPPAAPQQPQLQRHPSAAIPPAASPERSAASTGGGSGSSQPEYPRSLQQNASAAIRKDSDGVCPAYGAKAVIGRRPTMEDKWTAVPCLVQVNRTAAVAFSS